MTRAAKLRLVSLVLELRVFVKEFVEIIELFMEKRVTMETHRMQINVTHCVQDQ